MEVCEAQQDRQQLLAEKRKWQTEIENKRRQLEDDKRALQHLKSKALRERWLLEGAPSAGPQQDDVKRQLEQDEAKTRSLEETIDRLEEELVNLETGNVIQTITHTTVSSGSVKAIEVKGHSSLPQDRAAASGQVVQEVKVHKSPRTNKPREVTEEMKRVSLSKKKRNLSKLSSLNPKPGPGPSLRPVEGPSLRPGPQPAQVRAMYSVEIKVERDNVTGETRVLSTNTTLPVDLTLHGVKVYEDERKVVHEMNGEDGVQLLSYSQVEDLIHKADEASMMSETVATVTSLPTAEVQEEVGPEVAMVAPAAVEITGLEAKAGAEPSMAEASAENPVTMVFMGYQNVEDEDETKKVLGLQGTVKAELVHIDDANGKTSPGEEQEGHTPAPPPAASPVPPTATKLPETAATASNGETAGDVKGGAGEVKGGAEEVKGGVAEVKGGAAEVKKEKQPCKCCSIM